MKMRLTLLIENDAPLTIDEFILSLPKSDDSMTIEKIEFLHGNEKIINGLKQCSSVAGSGCEDCPYYDSNIDGDCAKELMRDAMEALR